MDHDQASASNIQDENEHENENENEKPTSISNSDADESYAASSPVEVDVLLDDEDASDEKTPLLAIPPLIEPSAPLPLQSRHFVLPPKTVFGLNIPPWLYSGLEFSIGHTRVGIPYRSMVRGFKTVVLLVKVCRVSAFDIII